ncbi:hypothetical protein XENOCAPTIV_011601 [Xenoophorus captivus]|uniref:Uncharacterized protein n=1 Tax=Xenoophorus captivus TaxID=1517983 RepID=A0ABV0QE65_9TELE
MCRCSGQRQYGVLAACFTENFISGRKLIYPAISKASTLLCVPQVICARVRELLGITETLWSRSIADPRRDPMALFLEKKSRTGEHAEALTFQRFLYDFYQ